jgi:hypothetical protein
VISNLIALRLRLHWSPNHSDSQSAESIFSLALIAICVRRLSVTNGAYFASEELIGLGDRV